MQCYKRQYFHPAYHQKKHHKVPFMTKQEYIGNQGSTISAHIIPTTCLTIYCQPYKIAVKQKGQRITYILTRQCMLFFGCSKVKNALLPLYAR